MASLPRSLPDALAQRRPEWKKVAFLQPQRSTSSVPAVNGVPAEAWIQTETSGKALVLAPNQSGEFPRVTIQPNETVQVAVAYQDLEPDLPIAIMIADGGTADGERLGHSAKLDAAGLLSFNFTAAASNGMYRVFLTTASGDRKMLHFWAGEQTQGPVVE